MEPRKAYTDNEEIKVVVQGRETESFKIADIEILTIDHFCGEGENTPSALQAFMNGAWVYIGDMEYCPLAMLLLRLPPECKVFDERNKTAKSE